MISCSRPGSFGGQKRCDDHGYEVEKGNPLVGVHDIVKKGNIGIGDLWGVGK